MVAPGPRHAARVPPNEENAVPDRTPADRGFFASLFDLNFTSFITLRFIKIIYGIALVLIGLATLVFFIAGLSRGGVTAVASFFLVPLAGLAYLVVARIYLELIAVLFRIGENTTKITAALGGGSDRAETLRA